MTFEPNETPGPPQVRKQLKRLLSSELFRTADKRSRLLSYVVESALSGQEISEKTIADNIFPPYDPENPVVRVNTSYLRASLKEYYETVGLNDTVVIALPPGPAYKPVFAYHPRAKTVQHHFRGLAYASQLTPNSLRRALHEFDCAHEADPTYTPAYTSASEVQLLRIITDHLLELEHPSRPDRYYAHGNAARALEIDPGLCLPHILIAMSALLSRRWEEARASFDRALSIDPLLTRTNLWYAFYLLISQQTDEAIAIAKSKVQEQPDNINMWLIYGLFLYLARRFSDALEAILEMETVGIASLFQSLLTGLIQLGLGDYQTACGWFLSASLFEVTEREDFEVYGLDPSIVRPDRFAGFMAWALARQAKSKEAEDIFQAMRQQPVRFLQMAFAELAVGQIEAAITSLGHAESQGDILTLGMDLWPFLGPFRGNLKFQTLVELYAYDAESHRLP